jgi:hypothetical protein
MLAAPLIAGNNISTMNDTIRDILTAPEIIAIDQDHLGIQGTRIRNNSGLQVWQKPLNDGSIAVALLNVTNFSAAMFVTLEEIGFKKDVASSVRDLWNRKDLKAVTDTFKISVEPHGVAVVKIKGKKSAVSTLKFVKASIKISKGNHQYMQLTVIPSITPLAVTSSNEDLLSLSIAGVNTYKLTAWKEGNCIIKASSTDGTFSSSCNVQILPSSIPPPWEFDDVKDNKASAVYDDGIFTIEGAGADIWGSSDQFAFVHRKAVKDNYISARIISQTNTDPWAKTGLMFRESNAPNSVFVMLCVTPGNGISLQWRETTGGTCSKKDFSAEPLPIYLKLSKNGSTFIVYKSMNGKQWVPLEDITLSRSFVEPYQTGMAVCSHSSHMLNLSKFDQLKVVPLKK